MATIEPKRVNKLVNRGYDLLKWENEFLIAGQNTYICMSTPHVQGSVEKKSKTDLTLKKCRDLMY